MAIVRLGSVAVTNSTSSGQNTSGATLLVAVNGTNASSAPTDSQSNTWTAITNLTGGGFGGTYSLWYVNTPSTHASSHTFTGSGTLNGLCVIWYSGTDTSGPLDQQCAGSVAGAYTTCTSALTPTTANSVFVTATGGPATPTALVTPAAFTIRQAINGVGGVSYGAVIADEIQTGTTARQPGWSQDGASGMGTCLVAIFKEGAGGGGAVDRPRPLVVRQAANRAGTF